MPLTDSQLLTEADVIKNETLADQNTATRVGEMLDDLINNKINNDKISTSTALGTSNTLVPSQNAVKTYADNLVVGLLDDRGNYNASVNTFPATGGSGGAGAILKGDLWYISTAGTLGGTAVAVGYSIRALVNTPGQTAGNWSISNVGLGYVPENVLNKTTDGTLGGNSDTLYPSEKAVKTYVDSAIAGVSFPFLQIAGAIYQSGTNAPNWTILSNTIGTVQLNYIQTGVYSITSNGLFTAGATYIPNKYYQRFIAGSPNEFFIIQINWDTDSRIYIYTTRYNNNTGVNTFSDNILGFYTDNLEIRVY